MTLETVPCDICGGTDFKILFPGTISNPDIDPSPYFSSCRSKAGYLPIARCNNCGLVMTNPRDDAATIHRIYTQLTDPIYEAEEKNRIRTSKEYTKLISRFCPSPGVLLDVGSSTGVFAYEAYSEGWQVTGLEPSTESFDKARRRCSDINWIKCFIEDANFHPGSYDAITLWDVLEHVPSPTQTLTLLREWLRPGGLNLPNSNSLIARLMGASWVLLLREHLYYFSPITIRQLLENTGFKLIHHQPNWVRFSITNIAIRLSQYPGPMGVFGKYLAQQKRIEDLSFTFPMGEMNIVAQAE